VLLDWSRKKLWHIKGKVRLTYSNPMMDYLMKQNVVSVLCSLILAVGFVMGMGVYELSNTNGQMFRINRITGDTAFAVMGEDSTIGNAWVSILEGKDLLRLLQVKPDKTN
jgi:hypothetical protein